MRLLDLKFGKLLKDIEFDWLGLTAEEYKEKKVLTYLNDVKYINELRNNKTIVGVITTEKLASKLDTRYGILIVNNPKETFFELHNKLVVEGFYYKKVENKISRKAIISPKATISDHNIEIEDGVVIEDNVTIYPNTIIKKNSIIRAGTRIGGNAFEFVKGEKVVFSVEAIGKVEINENVEIQNNCTIDRGVFSNTILEQEVKVDNLVHIGHDVKVGEKTFITAGVILAGRVKIGKNSYLGPNCTIRNGMKLGEYSKVTMGSVVIKDVGENQVVTGNFAIPHNKFLKLFKYLVKLIGE